MYSFNSIVRYSEVDKDKKLSDTALVNYFQDCSSFHSEELGVGMNFLEEAKRGWVLSYWQIDIKDRPSYVDNIKISTWPYDFEGFYGYRNFTIENSNGEVAAAANSIWVFINAETSRPAKPEGVFKDAYTLEPRFEGMEYEGRKIDMPSDMEERQTFEVRKSNIDTNCHVNNGQYIQMAQEYLPEDFCVESIRVSYKKSAVLGDVIYPFVSGENVLNNKKRFVVDLQNSENSTFAAVEFSGEMEK